MNSIELAKIEDKRTSPLTCPTANPENSANDIRLAIVVYFRLLVIALLLVASRPSYSDWKRNIKRDFKSFMQQFRSGTVSPDPEERPLPESTVDITNDRNGKSIISYSQDGINAGEFQSGFSFKDPIDDENVSGGAHKIQSTRQPLLLKLLLSPTQIIRAVSRCIFPLTVISFTSYGYFNHSGYLFVSTECILIVGLTYLSLLSAPYLDVFLTMVLIIVFSFCSYFVGPRKHPHQLGMVAILYLSVFLVCITKAYFNTKTRKMRYLRQRLATLQRNMLVQRTKEANELLVGCLPARIIPRLRLIQSMLGSDYQSLAERYPNLTCLFVEFIRLSGDPGHPFENPLDIATSLHTSRLAKSSLYLNSDHHGGAKHVLKKTIEQINQLFDMVDGMLQFFPNVEKVKTVANKAIFCTGVIDDDGSDHASDPNVELHVSQLLEFSETIRSVFQPSKGLLESNLMYESNFSVRMGMYFGDSVSGIMGKTNIVFDVIGDCINCASRYV
jgi:hypothetical protein